MPGGTVSDIGIGGLTVAGGYGWLTGQHGLVIDNLLSVLFSGILILLASLMGHVAGHAGYRCRCQW